MAFALARAIKYRSVFRDDWILETSHMARWLALSLIGLGLVMVWLGDGGANTLPRAHYLATALLLHAGACGIWLLERWHAGVAMVLGLFLMALLPVLGYAWMQLPGFLLLLPLPLWLALLSGHTLIAIMTAVASLDLLHILSSTGSRADLVLVTIGVAATLLIGSFIRRSFMTVIEWTWLHYEQAQGKLDVAYARNLEMDQVLDQLLHTNRQLDLLNERLAAMRARAEQAHRTKTAFVAKVSHEFRTPLNMIIGLIDLLIQTPEVYQERLPPRLLDDLSIVHRNCEHLASMINDVLDLSQTESGRLTLRLQEGDLALDVRHAVAVVQPLIEKKGVDLQVKLPDQPLRLLRDETRIRQVLLNLLSNAARYTATGSICVSAAIEGRHALIKLTDTGPGIAPEDCERIFEPFFQRSGLEGRSQKGTGLGLSISKQFVELHEGQLWVESVVGQGSTFCIRLPMASAIRPAEPPHRWLHSEWHWRERQPVASVPALPRNRRILVFDQTEGYYPILEQEVAQVEFDTVHELPELVDQLAQEPPHAIAVNAGSATDLLQMIEQVRTVAADTPILGWMIPSQTSKAQAAGAVDYLVKPVTLADLLACLALLDRPATHILIVDDDPDVQQLLARMLHSHDATIRITVAVGAAQAFEHLQKDKPDLMLVDLMLRQGTGWELLDAKQKDPTLREIPAVIISAQDPFEQPLASHCIIGTMGGGLPMDDLLDCSMAFLEVLLTPEPAPDPMLQ